MVEMGNPPSIDELSAIDGVDEVMPQNGFRFKIKFDMNKNVSEQIIALSVKNGWQLKEVAIEKQSLDLIFAHLSGKVN